MYSLSTISSADSNESAFFQNSFDGGSRSPSDDTSMEFNHEDLMYALYPFQKPKRVRRKCASIDGVPNTVHNDIRCDYAAMLINALNSHDTRFLAPFVEKYLTPTVTLTKPAVKNAVMVKPSTFVEGSEALVRYWGMLSAIIPDQVLQADRVQIIRRRNDDSCQIVIDLISSCTQLYEHQMSALSVASDSVSSGSYVEVRTTAEGVEYRTKKRKRDTSHVNLNEDFTCPCAPVYNAVDGVSPAVAFGPLRLRLLSKPMNVQMIMKLTLHVNENQQIFSLEYGDASLVF